VIADIAAGRFNDASRMSHYQALANVGQDVAIAQRYYGNTLLTISALGGLLDDFLPYIKVNDEVAIQRAFGYSSRSDVTQLKDLLISFRTDLNEDVMEYDLAIKQYDAIGVAMGDLYKIIIP
jgi:hypothetical protein